MKKTEKAMIIVPHPDDELNIAAPVFDELIQNNIEIYVMYTTNGDASKTIGNKRVKEAYLALEQLGVSEHNIIFLGYANDWKGEKHIYNSQDNDKIISKRNTEKTSCLSPYKEYCFDKHGIHRTFTRSNYKSDIKEVILTVLPDIIFCVDFDKHPDHRATTLFVDEVLGEIIKEKEYYHPILLKKYAYDGVWYGKRDYYECPRKITEQPNSYFYSGMKHELASPCFRWKDRIQFLVSEQNKTYCLTKNPLYKAAIEHKSTNAWFCLLGIINDDIVYWERNTNNLALLSDITVSSGQACFLNDFKLYDCQDVLVEKEPFGDGTYGAWMPERYDKSPRIELSLKNEKVIDSINIYESCSSRNHVELVKVFVDGNCIYEGELNNDGTATKILLEKPSKATKIEVSFVKWCGVIAITEIEVNEYFPKYKYPLNIYTPVKTNAKSIVKDKYFIYMKYIFKVYIKYSLKKMIRIMRKI